jgi:hypothetical protein
VPSAVPGHHQTECWLFPPLSKAVCCLGSFWWTPFFLPPQWLGHGQSGGPGNPAVSPVEVATKVARGAVWTPHPKMVVPPVWDLPKRGYPVVCSPVQVTQVRGSWAGRGTMEPHGQVSEPPEIHLPLDCGQGRVHVNAKLCQKGLVPPCPPSCLDPEANRSCSGHCVEGEAQPASRIEGCSVRVPSPVSSLLPTAVEHSAFHSVPKMSLSTWAPLP